MSKTLIFEGAGASYTQKNDVPNCRIRTRIKNNDGRIIYLEMTGHEVDKKYCSDRYKNYDVPACIWHCFFEDVEEDKKRNHSKELSIHEIETTFEYTKENILNFVNNKLNCYFDEIVISDKVRVHDTTKPLC